MRKNDDDNNVDVGQSTRLRVNKSMFVDGRCLLIGVGVECGRTNAGETQLALSNSIYESSNFGGIPNFSKEFKLANQSA